ncbi:unnamed protein product [Staurois parvus]|uniref:Uncharacterized protein n=1 Tax=Staurois parvus TaxID=386267 RepID=A0ABN9DDQ4_9NEOB|nr:unnamed protein product [Staurois parvus]
MKAAKTAKMSFFKNFKFPAGFRRQNVPTSRGPEHGSQMPASAEEEMDGDTAGDHRVERRTR